uniref:Uncharacterized protein n=1 Tax=Anguilla anguilla TaxID=7936 RepID=A0A0E9TC13_ANGAN
MRIPSYLGN